MESVDSWYPRELGTKQGLKYNKYDRATRLAQNDLGRAFKSSEFPKSKKLEKKSCFRKSPATLRHFKHDLPDDLGTTSIKIWLKMD